MGHLSRDPISFAGGVEASTRALIEGLSRVPNLEVHAISFDFSIRHDEHRSVEGVHFHRLPSPRRLLISTGYLVPRLRGLRLLGEIGPDVVHAQDTQMYGSICLHGRYPTVVSVHGIVEGEKAFARDRVQRLRARMQQAVQRQTVARAAHLVQPTTYPQSVLDGLGGGKWHQVPNAVAEIHFADVGSRIPGRILYAGAVTPGKRIIDLIHAAAPLAAEFGHMTIRIAGPINDQAYAETLRQTAVRVGIDNIVQFLGNLSPSELADEYSKCQVLVLPSGHETSPMVIAEAMASGTPVVASRVGGVDQLISDGASGLLYDAGDVLGLRDRIQFIIEDLPYGRLIGGEAQKQATARFRSEIVAENMVDVYMKAIADRRSG